LELNSKKRGQRLPLLFQKKLYTKKLSDLKKEMICLLNSKTNSMEDYFNTHPFAKIGILAVPLVIFMILMEIFFPKLHHEEYHSFITAFEFARTPADLHTLFNGFTDETFRNVDIGNYIDFGFMITYTLFLVLFFRKADKTFEKKWLLTGIPFALIVLLADVVENILLLQITGIYTPELTDSELIPTLSKLHFVTWIKWGGLALIFALFSIRSMGKNIVKHIEGVAFIIPVLLIFRAISNDPMGVSRFTLSIVLAFFLLLFYCFWFKAKKIERLKKKILKL